MLDATEVARAYLQTWNETNEGERNAVLDQYWAPDLRWLAPGHNPVSGWYVGRQAFLDFVNAWSATHGGVEAVSRIPASASHKGARAAKVLAVAFPDGLTFTKLPAAQAWAFGDRLVHWTISDAVNHWMSRSPAVGATAA